MVDSEPPADKSALLTELGGVVLSADAVSRVFVDLLACRESIESFELSSELDLDFRLDCECEMRRHALDSEGMLAGRWWTRGRRRSIKRLVCGEARVGYAAFGNCIVVPGPLK
jgi:hypothetical protein